ncbi:MAG: hypothetical protein J5I93_04195 [Pirellulaceae bacterium]|nr:hypothetical protein [Pirellulaceae bacterium]
MNDQRWFESLRAELRRRGLPEAYCERLCDELFDHYQECKEDTMSGDSSIDAILGTPRGIAQAAARQQSSWRSLAWILLLRSLMFIFLPLPLLALGWLGIVFTMGAAAAACEWASGASLKPLGDLLLGEDTSLARQLILVLAICMACAIVALEGLVARKWRITWPWQLCATALISVATAALFLHIEYTGLPGKNSLSAGLGLRFDSWTTLAQQILQGLLPFAFGTWIAWQLWRARLAGHTSGGGPCTAAD